MTVYWLNVLDQGRQASIDLWASFLPFSRTQDFFTLLVCRLYFARFNIIVVNESSRDCRSASFRRGKRWLADILSSGDHLRIPCRYRKISDEKIWQSRRLFTVSEPLPGPISISLTWLSARLLWKRTYVETPTLAAHNHAMSELRQKLGHHRYRLDKTNFHIHPTPQALRIFYGIAGRPHSGAILS